MAENNSKQENPEVCTINVAFAIKSDDQALDAKKKIGEALKDIEGVKIRFSIASMPSLPLPYGS